uniref:Putative myosin class ii heavy chain n=1 Tax=Tabanus bromius TaxID=304241 RepID=A0A0K8TMV5_TABBR
MPAFHINEMGEMVLDAVEDISVVDVYDLASEIGKECEKIIDSFGSDSITGLMPKVINALELLEALATKNENENSSVQELKDRINQLESEKLERAEFRKRFEKEIESIEEHWRSEYQELVELVSTLQDENKRIVKQQQEMQSQSSSIDSGMSDSIIKLANYDASLGTDGQILQRLKTQVNQQRDEIKAKDRELQEKVNDMETLNIQVERLKNSSRENRRRHKQIQVQVRNLLEEKADFLAQLQDQHREITVLRRRLGIAEKENEDLSISADDSDPNRPRYTTKELKELLSERDELMTKVNDLSEELKKFKPDNEENTQAENNDKPTPADEDAPVQGPLPFEPDDAPWKKSSESGIRKFFRKLFSDPHSPSFPNRSFSSLSKMALSSGTYSDVFV